jgi:hypothetical protein
MAAIALREWPVARDTTRYANIARVPRKEALFQRLWNDHNSVAGEVAVSIYWVKLSVNHTSGCHFRLLYDNHGNYATRGAPLRASGEYRVHK